MKGNPTALLPLFAPEPDLVIVTPLGLELRAMRGSFLSQQAVERFLCYMQSPHARMLGHGKRNRVPNHPELIETYGWDVKYGSHALRLAFQGHENRQHRNPHPAVGRGAARMGARTNRGEVPRDEVSAWAIGAQRRQWGW